MQNKAKHLSLFFFTIILISACGRQNLQTNAQATPTLQGLPPTWTPHIKTFTPSPTSIVVYTKTSTFTPRPTSTATQTPEPSVTPYYLIADFPKACQEQYFDYYTLISPDGNWLAEYCYSAKSLQISNRTGTAALLIPFKRFYDDPLFPELSGSLRPVHWSDDAQYIYFTVTPEQWMDGNASISELAPTLFRLGIANSEISQILGGNFYHSFSPTDRRLIEIQEYKVPVKIVVHDLKTGTREVLIPTGDSRYSQAGRVVWSPDGLKFVFVAGFGFVYGDNVSEPMLHSLILVDLSDWSQRIIHAQTPYQIEPVAWDDNDIITYDVFYYAERRENRTVFTYDFKSTKIIGEATPTP